MDSLHPLLPILWILLVLLGLFSVVALLVRHLRTRRLSRVTLEPERIRQFQVELTDFARRASFRPGMEVNLLLFFRGKSLKEPDRQAVIDPLIDSYVFGPCYRASATEFENMWNGFWRIVWRPTRYSVIVSQWVKEEASRGESVTLIIDKVLGGINMSQTDNSVNFGPRAGRDVIGGDSVGRDKAGRDAHGVTAGGSVANSANVASAHQGAVVIATSMELAAALSALGERAQMCGEPSEVLDALRWAAVSATSGSQPDPQEQAKHQRTFDRAGEWLQGGLGAIVEGVTGALAGHWLMSIIQG